MHTRSAPVLPSSSRQSRPLYSNHPSRLLLEPNNFLDLALSKDLLPVSADGSNTSWTAAAFFADAHPAILHTTYESIGLIRRNLCNGLKKVRQGLLTRKAVICLSPPALTGTDLMPVDNCFCRKRLTNQVIAKLSCDFSSLVKRPFISHSVQPRLSALL